MIPADWGETEPVEVFKNTDLEMPFVSVSISGTSYSQTVIMHQFTLENGVWYVEKVEFGRP
jgi:hypothetical protein